jgi:hypothetical protein
MGLVFPANAPCHLLRNEKGRKLMSTIKRYRAGIAGALLACLLAIGTAGAYDADIACVSLREVIAGSDDVTTFELVALGPLSVSQMRLDQNVINPEETLCTYLKSVIRNEATAGRPLSRIVLTLSFPGSIGEERTSYELSPSTNVFIRLEEPFSPNISPPGNNQEDSFPSFADRFLLKKGVTKSSVLESLQKIQQSRPALILLQSDTTTSTGTWQEARDAQITLLAAGPGKSDLALMKSGLIRKYTSG